ncbi:MAG: outer membrane protein transport protein [Candidatus Buchananbacteria bacterium]
MIKTAHYILISILLFLAIPQTAYGGFDRVAAIGTDIGNGSDPRGPWFPHNLGSKIQLRNFHELEAGVEVMIPKFTYKDWRGREFKSKNVAHTLPYLSFAERINEDMVWGVDISTDKGNGASFKKIAYDMDSRTLVSGTYIKPYLSFGLTDRLSVGAGPVIVMGMETWTGPFDFRRTPLPIRVDLQAMGFGVGWQVGAMYRLTDRLAFGVNYVSPVTVDLNGDCRINLGPIHLKDKVESKFQFADRLDLSAGYQPARDWLVVGQASWFGYSKNSLHQETVLFDKLPITKSVQLNWQDNYALYLGASRVINHWTIGGGVGYMGKAIDKTADFMTPDVAGFSMAGRIKYSYNDFDLTIALSRGWGKNNSYGKEITADVWTVSITGKVKF